MKAIYYFSLLFVMCASISCTQTTTKANWTVTAESSFWQEKPDFKLSSAPATSTADVTINTQNTKQTIDGFGACFNELGWTSLRELSEADREDIMKELFIPGSGANFTICRMPVAANDFSRDWYSYNEKEGDFGMESFSIDNDKETLIPFIKNAQKYKPDLQVWASPWCPPSWMKYNKHYASKPNDDTAEEKYRNGLPKERQGFEGTDMFIQEPRYLQAYALYFSLFIDAYREQGIDIFAVMPQNEFNSDQVFPSCCWTAASLANFVGNYLGPAMEKKGVEVMFGTMERANEALVDTILLDPAAGKYVKAVGFQWAGKGAVGGLHKRYPELKLYQTEQECGDGLNDWKGAMYSWNLMKHYLNNGVSAYMYWNISLEEGGISRWGWAQNSLVVVDTEKHSYRYTPEYYVLKHVSHYVQPGAYRLNAEGEYTDLLAFKNPDNSIVLVIANEDNKEKTITIGIDGKNYSLTLEANSLGSLVL